MSNESLKTLEKLTIFSKLTVKSLQTLDKNSFQELSILRVISKTLKAAFCPRGSTRLQLAVMKLHPNVINLGLNVCQLFPF